MMDYEQKYKEALERAKQVHKYSSNLAEIKRMEQIFPELKESEDEKMRNTAIYACQYMVDNFENSTKQYEDAIDWLEKQGEQKPQKVLTWKHWENGIAGNSEGEDTFLIKWSPWHYSVSSCLGCECDYIELSELDELLRKPNFRERYKRISESEWFKKTHEGMSVSEENEENIEPKPKFKVGDWIVCEACEELNTALITNIDDDKYEVEFIDGSKGLPHIDFVDRSFHIWTIQDAKDGDVLAEVNDEGVASCIFIIRKLGDNLHAAKTYFTLYDDGDFDDGTILNFDADAIKPATKEQRDQLEKAMTDAGYKWNKEQLKLEKIETAIGKLNDASVRKEFKWDSENKIMTIYGVTYEEMKALDDFIYCLRSGTKFPKGEKGEEGFTYQYPPTNIGHNEGINTPGKKPILVDLDDIPDNPVDAFAKGVEKARSEMESEPQAVTFIDSGTMQVIDKLNEIIGKLGDIYQVLSKPFQFPYRDYPPQGPWYKTHGVEKVPPVTCETLSTMLNVPHVSGTKGKKSPFNSEEEDNEE